MEPRMTRRQVSQALGVSEKSLYLWEKAGRIPAPTRDRRGWRAYRPEDVEAIRRLVGESPLPASEGDGRATAPLAGLTARNQLAGTIVRVRGDEVLSEVTLRLGDGQEVVSVVTTDSVRRLGLRPGQEATAVVKATEVMLFR